MKWQTLIILLIVVQAASALTVQPRTNITIQPHCYNQSGTFFGTEANLTVWNETGIYWVNDDITNTGVGSFAVNLTNLSAGHCYSLELGCEDAGASPNEHGTICVDKEEGNTMLGTIILLPLIFAVILVIGGMLLNKEEHEGLRTGIFAFSFFAFTVSAQFATIFISRIYGWSDVAMTMVKYVRIIWVVLGIFVLYLAAYHIGSAISEKRKAKNEQENY